MKHRLALAFGIDSSYLLKSCLSAYIVCCFVLFFPTQAPSPSLCCQGKLCSEMSTTSTRTCPSGRLTYIMSVPSYLFCQSHMACALITFFFSFLFFLLLCVTGYRMACSYFGGGKCTTQNKNNMVSNGTNLLWNFVSRLAPNVCNII